MFSMERRSRKPSLLAFCGGLLAATGIGLSAYAAHGISDPHAQSNVSMAALYAVGHGIALAALGPYASGVVGRVALYVLLLGTLLFSGSLLGGAVAGWPTTLAPAGGMALMGGWVLLAFSALRR